MKVLLVQESPEPGDLDRNIARVAGLVAAHPHADLAVFPELFLTGYDTATAHRYALRPDAERLGGLRRACAASGTALVTGFVEDAGAGERPYNSLLCVDRDGAGDGVYRKTHLFGAESAAFTAGDRLACTDLAGIRIGPMICFDLEFPEVARTLAGGRPDLLVGIAANMDPYAEDHDLAARSRALENRTPLVYANRVGTEAGFTFAGGSLATDGGGGVLGRLGRAPGVLLVDLPLRHSTPADLDYRAHLRPELYG